MLDHGRIHQGHEKEIRDVSTFTAQHVGAARRSIWRDVTLTSWKNQPSRFKHVTSIICYLCFMQYAWRCAFFFFLGRPLFLLSRGIQSIINFCILYLPTNSFLFAAELKRGKHKNKKNCDVSRGEGCMYMKDWFNKIFPCFKLDSIVN